MGDPAMGDNGGTRLVWDLPLRLFHWLLVVCMAGSWLTHELGVEWFVWHVRIGYVTLVLVAFRIAWGVVGPKHARFASFLRGPGAVLAYLRGRTPPPAGHNPLGALGVVAMLLLLCAQALTGLFSNDEILNTGPLYGYLSDAQSDRLSGLHKANFNLLIAFAAMHVAAIAWHRWRKRVDLVRPMWSGRKPAAQVPRGEEIEGHRLWLAAALVILSAVVLWRVVATAPPASMSFY